MNTNIRCEKCGNKDMNISFKEEGYQFPVNSNIHKDNGFLNNFNVCKEEVLFFVCRCCGYNWLEQPLDKKLVNGLEIDEEWV
jgi:hypothetical protein